MKLPDEVVVFTYERTLRLPKNHGPAFQEGIQSIFGAKPEFNISKPPA